MYIVEPGQSQARAFKMFKLLFGYSVRNYDDHFTEKIFCILLNDAVKEQLRSDPEDDKL